MKQLLRARSFGLILYGEIIRTSRERLTYRTQVILGMLTGLVGLAQFGIMGFYIKTGGTPPGLERYGGDIIPFMIVGSLFSAISLVIMNSLKVQIQSEQKRGTLEAIAMSQAGLFQFLMAGSVFGIVSSVLGSTVVFLVFGAIFDFKYRVDVVSLVVSVSISALCMWVIGLCAAAYILVSKQGEPITWTVTTVLALFSGVMFPTTIFPDYIVNLTKYLPTAGMLHAIRISLFSEAPINEVIPVLFPTICTLVIFLPIGVIMWHHAVQRVRLEGTLGGY